VPFEKVLEMERSETSGAAARAGPRASGAASAGEEMIGVCTRPLIPGRFRR
jgi:hypothetical protein